jgi:mannose-6-phosphate isomerase-like protein (cupin superfamily)
VIAANLARNPLDADQLTQLIGDVAATDSWRKHVRYNATERWWTRLGHDDYADVWLLSWLSGQATDLHDHGDSAAAFTVVSGALDEIRADAGGRLRRSTVAAGGSLYVAPGTVHDVRNPHRRPAISIHAYSPPLRAMTFYRPTTGGLRAVATVPTREPEIAGEA